MFHHIDGVVAELEPNLAVIDCGGVGYELNTTANTISRLSIGSRAKLYTYLHVREEIFELYGFYSKAEKRSFEMLLGVSGVGPKAALSILSANTPENLAMAIVSGNEKALTVASGIGKKIAQRIILELRDKLAKETEGIVWDSQSSAASVSGQSSAVNDAVAALTVLGYSGPEIAAALKNMDAEGKSTGDIIKLALRGMVK